MVSPKIKFYYDNNVIQYAGSTGMSRFTLRNAHVGNKQEDKGQYNKECYTDYGHGAAMMVPRKIIDSIGGMNEVYFLYYEELDWCERIRKSGLKIKYIPEATVFHKESISTGKDSALKVYYLTRNRILFARKNLRGFHKYISYLYMFFVSVPKNIVKNINDLKKLKDFLYGLLWNLPIKYFKINPYKN